MRKKRPVNLSLQPGILDWANKIMVEKRFASLSVLVEELIRERYDQVFGKSSARFPEHREELTRLEDKPAARKKTGT